LKKVIIILGLFGLIILCGLFVKQKFYDPKHQLDNLKILQNKHVEIDNIKEGDLIFQSSLSEQCKAIQLATKSKYSHCGIIFDNHGELYVLEAVQPVRTTSLNNWIARGKNGHYVIKRLKNADKILTIETLPKMKREGEKLIGKNYDLTFEWSDDNIYCSELIWKIYQRAVGLEIGTLEQLRDFDLTNKEVKQKLKERYGDNIPMDQIVISPAAIFNSELLMMVKSDSFPQK
jgi:hypothetical protein